ncbi:MAG TPA: cupin domain-containing protein [Clostridia bacterium]|nr:cupin domain-containing protein [Clostridia bacterium]
MIKMAGHQQVRIRENVRGGEGALVFHDFLMAEESFGSGKLFSRTVLPAGASIGEHRHDGEFEVYYVLAGTVEVLDCGTWTALDRGDMHLCANGESHALRNSGKQEAEVLMLILNDQTGQGK